MLQNAQKTHCINALEKPLTIMNYKTTLQKSVTKIHHKNAQNKHKTPYKTCYQNAQQKRTKRNV
jgi:hypothetical protein